MWLLNSCEGEKNNTHQCTLSKVIFLFHIPPSTPRRTLTVNSPFFFFCTSINTKTKHKASQTVIIFKVAEQTCKNNYALEIF